MDDVSLSGTEKFDADSMSVAAGLLNTELNCFCRMLAICPVLVQMLLNSSYNILMLCFCFENFLA